MDKQDISQLTSAKTFYGYPIEWFEKCDYLNADGHIEKDGTIFIDGGGGQPIRMMNRYRKEVGWN